MIDASFDAHVHLQDYPKDILASVLGRARAVGVVRFGCCGTKPSDWSRVLYLSETEDGVEPSFGVHPWYVDNLPENWVECLEEYVASHSNAGIGEIGLDGLRGNIDLQTLVFVSQLELAAKYHRRVTVHCVRANEKILPILKEYAHKVPCILIHSFSSSVEEWRKYERLGIKISFGCAILNKHAQRVRELAKIVPDDMFCLETDSPYMVTEGCGIKEFGNLNAPENLIRVIRVVNELKLVTKTQLT